MRQIPVDASKIRLISAGDTVETVAEYVELSDGGRRRSGNQAKNDDGVPMWVVYAFVPAEQGERPEMVKIKVASREEPQPGAFGDVLEFADLFAIPYVDQGTTRVALSFRCSGVRVAGGKVRPQPQAA